MADSPSLWADDQNIISNYMAIWPVIVEIQYVAADGYSGLSDKHIDSLMLVIKM